MYTNAMVMGWMLDQYSTIVRAFSPAVITGKPIPLGGSAGRETATADGAFHVLSTLLPKLGLRSSDGDAPTVALQGFGTAGAQLATLLDRDGYKVVAVADSRRAVLKKDGLDVQAVRQAKKEQGTVPSGAGEEIDPDDLLELEVDILVPAALEDVITDANADRVKASVVLEVANGPTSLEADAILAERGVTVIPDILANAGGVIVSYFEWAQNRQGVRWSEDEGRERLRDRIVREAERIWELAHRRDIPLRTAAYAQGLERISAAVDATGTAEAYQQRQR
jgi:glutamate dehydrogenase (NADP+)